MSTLVRVEVEEVELGDVCLGKGRESTLDPAQQTAMVKFYMVG